MGNVTLHTFLLCTRFYNHPKKEIKKTEEIKKKDKKKKKKKKADVCNAHITVHIFLLLFAFYYSHVFGFAFDCQLISVRSRPTEDFSQAACFTDQFSVTKPKSGMVIQNIPDLKMLLTTFPDIVVQIKLFTISEPIFIQWDWWQNISTQRQLWKWTL